MAIPSDALALLEGTKQAVRENYDLFQAQNKEHFDRLRSRVSDLEAANGRRGLGGSYDSERSQELSKALRLWLRDNDATHLKSLMAVSSDPAGGYWVVPEFESDIIATVKALSPLRRLARVYSIGSDSLEMITDTGEFGGAWVEESGTRSDTDVSEIGKITIFARELYAQPVVTQKLLDDAMIDVGEWVARKIGQRFARLESSAFISGDGIGKPRGLLTYPISTADDDVRAFGTVEYVPSGAAGAFASTDPQNALIDLVTSLQPDYRTNARWLMNRATAGTIRKFKDSEGRFIWQDSLVQGQPSLLLGFPVEIDEFLPTVAANSLSVALGDFSAAYAVVDRAGVRALRDPFTRKGYVKFYTWRRVGGDVMNTESYKLLKMAAS